MPIRNITNNRMLPANARSSDVAADAINALSDVQRTRYHAAFKPQGFTGVLYHTLNSGMRCHCKSKAHAVATRLDGQGHATPGALDEMLAGGMEFGVMPYGVGPAPAAGQDTTTPYVPANPYPTYGKGEDPWLIDQEAFNARPRANTPGAPAKNAYNGVPPTQAFPANAGNSSDVYGRTSDNGATTIIDSGVGPNGPVDEFDFEEVPVDFGLLGLTDANCPVCMGSGFVGGYSILNGFRIVLNYQHPGADFGAGQIMVEETVPRIVTRTARFTFILPKHGVSVDTFRVWNGSQVIQAKAYMDNTPVASLLSMLAYCDGRPHELLLEWNEDTEFTHVELQINQSSDPAYFDFPKLTQSSMREQLDAMQDTQVLFSPKIPLVRPGDFLSESTYGKVMQVKSCTPWNDRRRTILGWEAEVRIVQPQELFNMLPRRRALEVPRSPSMVRDNGRGHRRT